MGTTAQKLNKILETKEAIRTAINNKGGTLTTTDTFASYPSAIDSLPSGGGSTLKTLLDATKKCYYLFNAYSGSTVDGLISYNDTENVTFMREMFSYCENLISTPKLNTNKVTNMISMFYNCRKLTTIDISHMNISNSSKNSYFAYNCYSLTKLIIRNMSSTPALESDAFTNCYHFNGTTNATWNPNGLKDGRIYVPDDKVDALKRATNWSRYADIIVPLSTLVE